MKPLVTSYRDLPAAALVNGVLQPAYAEASYAGTFFYCKSAPTAFRMAFDAGQFFDWDGGYKIANTPFRKIVFANDNLFPIRIYFSIGIESVDYIGTNDEKVAPTFTIGSGGNGYRLSAPQVKTAANAGWEIDGNTAPDLTKNNLLFFPGLSNGHRRKQITFLCQDGSNPLAVFNDNGGLFCVVNKGQVLAFETSDDFYCGGSGGPADRISISEIFYAN
jgi:hypothetical protein